MLFLEHIKYAFYLFYNLYTYISGGKKRELTDHQDYKCEKYCLKFVLN